MEDTSRLRSWARVSSPLLSIPRPRKISKYATFCSLIRQWRSCPKTPCSSLAGSHARSVSWSSFRNFSALLLRFPAAETLLFLVLLLTFLDILLSGLDFSCPAPVSCVVLLD
ncbi:hypothetical protein BJX65DRAFT_165281 [Aspergillus insuetus]